MHPSCQRRRSGHEEKCHVTILLVLLPHLCFLLFRAQVDNIVHHRDVFDKIFTRIGAETSLISDETSRLNEQIEAVEAERDKVAAEMNKQVRAGVADIVVYWALQARLSL